MKISILTMCPEMFGDYLRTHAVTRAAGLGLAEVEIIDIRDFAGGSYRHIDDSPFGGGRGLILRCQPVLDALESVRTEGCHTAALVPVGRPYQQADAHRLAGQDHLILICGHYEGMDARIYDHVDELISIGDYILTGGELAAMVVTDSVIRLRKGNLKAGSAEEESFENGLLEYPQYTQPADFRGQTVPQVLLSGHHEKIRRWRLKESLRLTLRQRPDLLEGRRLSPEESGLLEEIRAEDGAEAGK